MSPANNEYIMLKRKFEENKKFKPSGMYLSLVAVSLAACGGAGAVVTPLELLPRIRQIQPQRLPLPL